MPLDFAAALSIFGIFFLEQFSVDLLVRHYVTCALVCFINQTVFCVFSHEWLPYFLPSFFKV